MSTRNQSNSTNMSKNKDENPEKSKLQIPVEVIHDDLIQPIPKGRKRFDLGKTAAASILKLMVVSFLVPLWLSTRLSDKLFGVVCACAFSVIESCFCKITEGTFHTTTHQWIMNILVCPWLIVGFLDGSESLQLHERALMFPGVIWFLELVQGYSLQILCDGVNPAWEYNSWDAFFHGNVRLLFGPLWILLGLVTLVVAPPVRVVCDDMSVYIFSGVQVAFDDLMS